MSGDVHVRFCEGVGVRFPRATRLVLGFQNESEAKVFLQHLNQRLAKFGLELHEGKTRLIEFGRFAIQSRCSRGKGKPETFDFLGFTHICSKQRKTGYFTVRRKTIANRLRAKVKEVRNVLKLNRHRPVSEQGKWLRAVVRGYFNYHAVPGNQRALQCFRTEIIKSWLFALRRRSQKGANFTWERMNRLKALWIPSVRVLHPYPNQRFCV